MSREACRRVWFPLVSSLILVAAMGLGTAAATGDVLFGFLTLCGGVCLWFCGAFWAGAVIDINERSKSEGTTRPADPWDACRDVDPFTGQPDQHEHGDACVEKECCE